LSRAGIHPGHDRYPVDPSTAQQLYLDHEASHCEERTVAAHRYRTNHVARWCDQAGLESMTNLTGRHPHDFRLGRKDDGDLNLVSVQTQMSTLRVFMEWCGSIETYPRPSTTQ
jgi:site-specific recombinase XerC